MELVLSRIAWTLGLSGTWGLAPGWPSGFTAALCPGNGGSIRGRHSRLDWADTHGRGPQRPCRPGQSAATPWEEWSLASLRLRVLWSL